MTSQKVARPLVPVLAESGDRNKEEGGEPPALLQARQEGSMASGLSSLLCFSSE